MRSIFCIGKYLFRAVLCAFPDPVFGIGKKLTALFLFVLSFLITHTSQAQLGKEANFWYFGTNAGLDFNGGAPVSVTNSVMNISEGCSSISDKNGNLLFYTDGRTVFNKNHVVMGNGAGLSAGPGGSSTQGALIVKRPGSNTLYYIFTLDEQANANGLCYSVVDMSLNAGLGAVTTKNTQLYTPSTEKMTAVKHCNGVDVWLITHEKDNNTFRNFLITSAGIGAPVTSSVGTALNVGAAYAGQMKVSPTGAKLALVAYTSSNVLEVFDFNNVAGTVTNPITVGNNPWGYGLEFSPNGRYLYVSDVQNKKIYQYDVCAGSSAALAASKIQVGASANSISSLQLGPNKKIYAARSNGSCTWLGVINSPNSAGIAANYVDNGVSLAAGWNQQGLPGFVQSFFRDTFPHFTYATNCLTATFNPPPTNCANPINAVSWNFGEPSSGAANTSTLMNPSHTYTLPGNYSVRLIVNCVDTIIKTIPVVACPLIVTSNNSSVCPGICASVSANVSAGAPGYTYSWSPNIGAGPGPYNVCPTSTTVYTVTVTDLTGTTAVSTSTVTVSPATTANMAKVDITCNGSANGTISVNPSGGTPGYTYSWSTGAMGVTSVSNLAPGSYSVTITDANGCSSVTSATITQPLALATPTVATSVTCNGGSNGTAGVNPSGGTSGYLYSWSNTKTTQNITGIQAGVYTVTVTDSKGCKAIASINVTQPATPVTATLSVVNHVSCFAGSNGAVSATGGGGTPGYTYSWNSGNTTSTVSNLMAGSYSVTITDSKGCTIAGNLNVTQPSSALSGTVNVTGNVTCFNGNNGSATVAAAGGTAGYTYSWSNGNTSTNNTGLAAGNYSVTITDSKGCTYTSNVNITQPASGVTATVTVVSNVSCNGLSNGALTANASGGTGGYTYSWTSGGVASQGISNLAAGTYSVVVTDAGGCTAAASATITQPTAIAANANVLQNVSCFGGTNGSASSVANGGTTPYSYSWSTAATSNVITGLSSGTYTVTITDNSGCSTTATVNVTQPASAVTVTVSVVNHVSCYNGSNGSLTANTNGGTTPYTFAWSPGTQANQNATGLVAGSYTATVTDANGCTALAFNTITQPATPLTATVSVLNNVLCNGGNNGSATINAGGGTGSYTYSWSNSQTAQTSTGLPAGAYSATVTDANGCTATGNINITQPASAVSLTITVDNNVSCNGGNNGAMSVNASGGTPGYNYVWWGGQTTTSVSGLTAGTYSATVTDAIGCTSTATANITQPGVLSATVTISQHVSCYNGSDGAVAVVANGGTIPFNYSWSVFGATQQAVSNLSAGVYTATVIDALGCVTTASATVTQPLSPLTGTISVVNHVSCFGGSNGSATINAGGGTVPYNYSWSNSQTINPATGMPSGLYTVTVTDANGCTITDNVNITQPTTAVSITVTALADVSCNGGNDGVAEANASGGTGAFTYSWSTASANSTISSLTAGAYTATVTDANGCTATGNVNITQPLPININLSSNVTICDGAGTTLTTGASGGTPGYNYLWSTAETTASINVTPAASTNYSVVVSDANNCTIVATVSVTVSDPLAINAISVPGQICVGKTAMLSAGATGGMGANNFTWTPGGINTATVNVNPTGTTVYTVSVTNTCGVVSTTLEVVVNDLPVVAFSVDDPDGCPEHCVTFSNTTPNSSSLVWLFGDGNSSTAMPDAAHCYSLTGQYSVTLTVTDANGCSNTLEKQNYITVFPEPVANFIASPQQTSILAPTVNFTNQSLNSDAWLWSFGDPGETTSTDEHTTFNYSNPGTYTVQLIATNSFGCTPDTAWQLIEVKEDYALYVPNTFTPNGDGINELFMPLGMGLDIQTFEMYIYDRWGNLIYKTNDMYKGWDGRANGGQNIAQQDTYVWKIRVIDVLGNIHSLVGHVNIVR